jgi:hypothetical protein
MKQHTATPWKLGTPFGTGIGEDSIQSVQGQDEQAICRIFSHWPNAEANATFIVQAANNHAPLVQALKEIKIRIPFIEPVATRRAIASYVNNALDLLGEL